LIVSHRLVIDLTDRRALESWKPAAPETIAEARRLKEAALLDFGLSESALASWLYTKCRHHIPTTAIDTAAVIASGDGTCLLVYNPDFFCALGLDGVKFVLFHEARHLVHRHLHVDEALRADPVFELAAEVAINHVALVRLGRDQMPLLRGEPTGIDPREIHARYQADLREQGLDSLDYDAFVETDHGIYGELKRMKHPPIAAPLCIHQILAALPLDQETADLVASSALLNTLLAARRGNLGASGELLDLMARTEGSSENAARIWGRLGAGVLRGQTAKTRRVQWWQRWLVDVLASRLAEGERLVYPKKRGALLAALGQDPMLSRRGPVRERVLVIALDTSGSMSGPVVDWLAQLVGQIDRAQVRWLAFDAQVYPFRPGQALRGGGGTSFQAVADYVEGRAALGGAQGEEAFFDERPDAVIVLTDGYAPPITPADPDTWIWLITAGGNDWPEHHTPAMACHRVTRGEG
jgi:hypothetical protein